MKITDILTPERTARCADTRSKKKVLQRLSELLASESPSLLPGEVFDSLFSRERLGSTGLGRGVALPHGRYNQAEDTIGAFLILDDGIEYDSPDGEPVDLLFALLVPEVCTDEHLEILSRLAEMFSDAGFRERLRQQEDAQQLYRLIAERSAPASNHAASVPG